MGKIVSFIGIAIVIAIMVKPDLFPGGRYNRPTPLDQHRSAKSIEKVEFQKLFDSNKPLSSLAMPGHYTVVEGYLDSCAICKRIEANFPAFLDKRKDVVIRRVHLPEAGMNISFTGSDQSNIEQQVAEYNKKIKSYNLCSTPHIEIYDDAAQVLIADSCTNKPATTFLQQWMSDE